MNLTKNFSLNELTQSETALRKGIDNAPTQDVINNLQKLAVNVLQPVRDHYGKGVKVTSGYRSPALNAEVGGSKVSHHCKGMAADIEIPGFPNSDLAQHIVDTYKFTQVILEFYTPGVLDSGWVHVSYDEKDLKCEVLTAVKKDGKTVYLKGLHK